MRSVFHLAFFPHRVLGLPLLPFYLRLGGREEGDERERWSARWYDGEGRHGLDGGTSRERPPDGRTQSEVGGTLEWKAKTWKGPKGRKERESGAGSGKEGIGGRANGGTSLSVARGPPSSFVGRPNHCAVHRGLASPASPSPEDRRGEAREGDLLPQRRTHKYRCSHWPPRPSLPSSLIPSVPLARRVRVRRPAKLAANE